MGLKRGRGGGEGKGRGRGEKEQLKKDVEAARFYIRRAITDGKEASYFDKGI